MSAEPPEDKTFSGFLFDNNQYQREIEEQKREYMKKRDVLVFYPLFTIIICLNAFNVFSGVAELSWDAPTINADGRTLTDLDGYIVYHGTSSGNYSQSIDVGNVTTYSIDNLTDGLTYYFVVTGYDTSGNESQYSNEMSKAISSANQQSVLTVDKNGTSTGTGTIASSPSGINCGSDCMESYNAGTLVTLTATPDASSTFEGWSSGGCSGTGQCVITMNSDINVTASFTLYTIDIDGDGYISDVDCNDNNKDIYPGALEVCNGVDDNCDGQIDEGFDVDKDGYTTCAGDCDDNDTTINPGSSETDCNGVDNDCDSLIDENYSIYTCGIGACEASSKCDNGIEFCNPENPIDEICGDNIDNDCDGETDEGCTLSVFCGNKVCSGNGENCYTCPEDCRCSGKNCSKGCCGDGLCTGNENNKNCSIDCLI